MIEKSHFLRYPELTHKTALQLFDFVQGVFAGMDHGSELVFNQTPNVGFELTKHIMQPVTRARP